MRRLFSKSHTQSKLLCTPSITYTRLRVRNSRPYLRLTLYSSILFQVWIVSFHQHEYTYTFSFLSTYEISIQHIVNAAAAASVVLLPSVLCGQSRHERIPRAYLSCVLVFNRPYGNGCWCTRLVPSPQYKHMMVCTYTHTCVFMCIHTSVCTSVLYSFRVFTRLCRCRLDST